MDLKLALSFAKSVRVAHGTSSCTSSALCSCFFARCASMFSGQQQARKEGALLDQRSSIVRDPASLCKLELEGAWCPGLGEVISTCASFK